MDSTVVMTLVIIVIVAVIVVITSGVKIVQPYEQAIYMRLGKFVRVLNQGLNFVCPLINQVVKLDLRTEVLDVPKQEVITKDNSPVEVDAVIYIKVTDPKNAFFEVTNYRWATVNLAQTTLRSIIGEMELDQILSSRERINVSLRDILDENTDKPGRSRTPWRSRPPPRGRGARPSWRRTDRRGPPSWRPRVRRSR